MTIIQQMPEERLTRIYDAIDNLLSAQPQAILKQSTMNQLIKGQENIEKELARRYS